MASSARAPLSRRPSRVKPQNLQAPDSPHLPFADNFPPPAHTQSMIATAQIVGQTRTAPPSLLRLLAIGYLLSATPCLPYPLPPFPKKTALEKVKNFTPPTPTTHQ